MARTELTRNLKLRLTPDLSADSRYNLQRIDTLASLFYVNSAGDAVIRSTENIQLIPKSPDIGGTGSGGSISLGSPDQTITDVNVYASNVNFRSSLSLPDQASGGTKSLLLQYKTDAVTPGPDTAADRTLSFDLQGADRYLALGASLSLTAAGPAALTLPTSGTLATLAGTESFSNKTLDRLHFQSTFSTSLYQATAGQSANLSWYLPPTDGSTNQVLKTDGFGQLGWTTVSTTAFEADIVSWLPADGATKTINHTFDTKNILVQIKDENDQLVEIDSISFPTTSLISLIASGPPTGVWSVQLFSLE